jgi:hypothetical protein
MGKIMNIETAIRELKADVESLAKAHGIMLSSMQTLADQLEIARHNVEILQDVYLKSKTAISTVN